MKLEGFAWRKAEKPTLEDVVSYYRKEGYVEKDIMEKIEEVQKKFKIDDKVIPSEIKNIDKDLLKNRNIQRLKNTEF